VKYIFPIALIVLMPVPAVVRADSVFVNDIMETTIEKKGENNGTGV